MRALTDGLRAQKRQRGGSFGYRGRVQ